jgi:hypothetical protein
MQVQTNVTDDMKQFLITRFINGTETETEIRFFCQQAIKCLSLPKYQAVQGDVQISLDWKEILSPWFEPDSRAATFLQKQDIGSPQDLFDALLARRTPKVFDYSVSLLELVQQIVLPKSFDNHQISIEKYVRDLISRRYKDQVTILLAEKFNLATLPMFQNGLNAEVLRMLEPQVSARYREVERALALKIAADISSEFGMAIIGADQSLFSSFDVKKPTECSLTELVNTIQVKHLDITPNHDRSEKLIRLCYQRTTNSSPIISRDEHEKSLKRKREAKENQFKSLKSSRVEVQPSQAPQIQQTPQQQPKPQPQPRSLPVGGATQQTLPSTPFLGGKKVAVACPLCKVSTDPSKVEKSVFHKYESCFDHPTLGVSNKIKMEKKRKFAGGKK